MFLAAFYFCNFMPNDIKATKYKKFLKNTKVAYICKEINSH